MANDKVCAVFLKINGGSLCGDYTSVASCTINIHLNNKIIGIGIENLSSF
jgi:hypothetical protein